MRRPERRADAWVDGTHGLYRMECDQGHVWLSALASHIGPVRGDCPRCSRGGRARA